MTWILLLLATISLGTAAEIKPRPPAGFVSNLPLIWLDAKEPIASETKVGCAVQIMWPKGAKPVHSLTGLVRIHGASSQMYPKKSYAISLGTPVRWIGSRANAHWVLNAAFVDRSLMRHKLSYDLFRALSRTNSPRFAAESRFVEVFVNGRYEGAYLLMERVDRAMLGLHPYDSNATRHACIYKALDHVANFDEVVHDGYEQREPDPLLKEYWTPLDELNRVGSSRRQTDLFDSAKGISTRLDLQNTIDFHLLILLTSNMDGFDKNLILARDAPVTNAPLPRFFFVPWDYDATFGRSWEGSPFSATAWLSNHLFEKLLRNPSYAQEFGNRWRELRGSVFSVQNINRLIDLNVAEVAVAAERNAARWRDAESYYPDRLTLQQDVAQMKNWVTRRTQWLDHEIERRTRTGATR